VEPQLIKEAIAQGQKLSALLDNVGARLQTRRTSKDRVLHWLQDFFVFQQGQNTVQNLVFNVPKGFDFEAARFNLYPEIRVVVTDPAAQGPSDLVFRPAAWFTSAGATADQVSITVDGVVELTYSMADGKTRRYQNAAFYVAQTFSDYVNINDNLFSAYTSNQCPGGLVFDPFYLFERGSTMTCRFTPLYSGPKPVAPAIGADDRLYEYRIRGVFEGYKRL